MTSIQALTCTGRNHELILTLPPLARVAAIAVGRFVAMAGEVVPLVAEPVRIMAGLRIGFKKALRLNT